VVASQLAERVTQHQLDAEYGRVPHSVTADAAQPARNLRAQQDAVAAADKSSP